MIVVLVEEDEWATFTYNGTLFMVTKVNRPAVQLLQCDVYTNSWHTVALNCDAGQAFYQYLKAAGRNE